MRTIKQDELYRSLCEFLKVKGVELTNGAYSQSIRNACTLLGETINATQRTARKAKGKVDKKLDQVRQSIHDATAPRPSGIPAEKPASPRAKKQRRPRADQKRTAAIGKRGKKQ